MANDTIEKPRVRLPRPEPAPVLEPPLDAPPAPKKRRGPLSYLIGFIVLAGVGYWLFGFIHHSLNYRETDDAYTEGHVHMVASRATGDIVEVLASENEIVKAGQPLARIDAREFETAVQRAQANLAEAQAMEAQAAAAIDQVKADEAQSQAGSLQAQTQVSQAQAQLAMSTQDYDRNKELYGKDGRAVSKAELDSTEAAFKANTAALEGARANLAAVQAKELSAAANVKAAEAQLASATARIAVQQAAVADAERELTYTTIIAPADGRIGNKNIEVGNRVQVGQALFAVVEKSVWVVANFKETQLGRIQPGQEVELTIDTFPKRKFSGKVEGISPATGAQFALLPADNATGNFTKVVQRVPVKILFDDNTLAGLEDRMQPGLSTVVNVRVK